MTSLPVELPRLVVAAPCSGSGKTTIATGLMGALTARGLRVSPHKVGPDYIDPGYHALATGRPGRNLDAFLCGPERVVPLFLHGARGADVAVIEGVMGLYDGAQGRGDFASTAHVARLLQAPAVLVVDASGLGRSVAALVSGFASYDSSVRIGGVVLNRVGSPRHEEMLREAVAGLGIPVLGALRRDGDIATPSRHLGLVPVAERRADAVQTVDRLGALVAAQVDVEALLALARSAPALRGRAWDPAVEAGPCLPGRPVVAVAGGPAFTFSYAEHAELLAAAGAEVVQVDPLHDEGLPAGTAALVVGGGFPEVYAGELSANGVLRRAVARLAGSGAPVAAECAGLLYLARSLAGAPMCGVLDTEAAMGERLTLGYREAVAATDSVLATSGEVVRGHEFHRSTVTPAAPPDSHDHEALRSSQRPRSFMIMRRGAAGGWAAPAWQLGGRREGFVQGGVHASYLHLHWVGHPSIARRLVAAAAGQAAPGQAAPGPMVAAAGGPA